MEAGRVQVVYLVCTLGVSILFKLFFKLPSQSWQFLSIRNSKRDQLDPSSPHIPHGEPYSTYDDAISSTT